MIIFKQIKYKNLLSVGNQFITIQLDKSPTTVITGRNGAGKSSLLDALYFALFGKPFRNIKIPQLVNSINGSSLEVELDFSIGNKKYKIIRGLRSRKFEIYENDVLIDQDSSARDYQTFLEDSILGGLNENVFKQVVVIGSADYRPFMQLPASSRREVIEELLDVKIFSQMLKIVKHKSSVVRESLRDLDYQIDLLQEKIKINKEREENDKETRKNKIADITVLIAQEEEKKKEYATTIHDLTLKNKELNSKVTALPVIQKVVKDLKQLMADLNKTSKSNKSSIDFYTNNNTCPTCTQKINEKFKQNLLKELEESDTKISEGLSKIKDQLDKKLGYLNSYEEIQANITKISNGIFKLETKIKASDKYIAQLKKEIADNQNAPLSDTSVTIQYQKELKDAKALRVKQIEDQDYYTIVSAMLKDGGIKTKIIKQYIPLMNKTINEYLIRFNLPVNFTLDENFNEIIKSRYRDNFQYSNFSEGEKSRIDIALLLAWRHIAGTKNTISTNLLIFDETMDSSLDVEATEELLNILLEMKNTNIFIISHKQDLSDKLRSQIIFEKHGNFTRMIGE